MRVLILVVILYQAGLNYGGKIPLPKSYNQSAIVGGDYVHIREFPMMAFLYNQLLFGGSLSCGAVILNVLALLTSAHCTVRHTYRIRISIGTTFIDRGLHYYTRNYTIHESFVYHESDYDISIVRTLSEMYLDKLVSKAVVLASVNNVIITGESVTIVGWGETNGQYKVISKSLKKTKLPIVTRASCQKAYGEDLKITKRIFCAGEFKSYGTNMCIGDMGGPALNKDGVQVGVMAVVGPNCGTKGEPAVFVNIASMREWIDKYSDICKTCGHTKP